MGIDISPIGLHIARREATQRNVKVELMAVNLHDWPLPHERFDLVCVFRFLDRVLCHHLPTLLRPGGVLMYETFTVAQRNYLGGPRSDALLLQPNELPRLFSTLEQFEYNEQVLNEAGRPRALVGCVGRKNFALDGVKLVTRHGQLYQ